MQRNQMMSTFETHNVKTGRVWRTLALTLGIAAMSVGCPGCPPPLPDAGPGECGVTFTDPRDGVTLTTAADDQDANTDGIQFDVRVTTDCSDGTVTLFNDETGEEVTQDVGTSETLTFADFTIEASNGTGTENILRAVSTPDDQVASEALITVTGVDETAVICTITSPAADATLVDADANADGFQVEVTVNCSDVAAGTEVDIFAGNDAVVVVSLDANGNATATVTTDDDGLVALTVRLTDDNTVSGTINVNIPDGTPDCDATIVSPADNTDFGAGSPDQSVDPGFQILVRVSTDIACEGATVTVSVGGETFDGVVGANGEADVIVTLPEGSSTMSASVELNGNAGAADTISLSYTPGAIGMTVNVDPCGTFGDGCFNTTNPDSDGNTATYEQDVTVFAPAIGGACPYTDPTITVDGGPSVGGATWTYDATDDRCVATFTNLTLAATATPDSVLVALAVTATTTDGTVEVANFSLGLDLVAPTLDVTRPQDAQVLNEATDTNLGDGFQVQYQVVTTGLRDGAAIAATFSSPDQADDVVEVCTVANDSCTILVDLGDGAWTASATVLDEAGNPGAVDRVFSVDATRPTVSSITLSADVGDDGVIAIVADTATAPLSSDVVVVTDLPAGTTIAITVDGIAVPGAVTDAAGSATFSAVSIPEGDAVAIVVTGTDAAGNPFVVAGATRNYLIDLTAPTITIAIPDPAVDGLLVVADDTQPGVAGLQIDFTVATDVLGGSVTLTDAGGSSVTINADAAGLAFFPDFAVGEGTRDITATVSDAAGNTSTTPVYAPLVDSEAPELTITAPSDGLTLNAGNDADGNINNGLQTTFSVTTTGLNAGDIVQIVSSAEGVVGSGPVAANGSADIPVTFLADVVHTVTAEAFDENGNPGSSPAQTLTAVTGIYSLSVTAPVLVGAIRGIGTAQDTDAGTAGAQVVICADVSEPLPIGSTAALLIDGLVDAGAVITIAPANQVCAATTLADGQTGTFEISVDDNAGKQGTSGPQAFAVDLADPTVAISVPTAGTVFNIASDANVGQAGLQTTVTFTTSKDGSASILDVDGLTVISGPTDVVAGTVNLVASDTVGHDAGDWTVRVTDAVGNVGEATVNVTVDVEAPDLGVLTVVLEDRRLGLLRAEFSEAGDDGTGGGDVVSLEIVAADSAIANDAAFDAAVAQDGSPGAGGLFVSASIDGAGTAHADLSIPLAYDRTWTVAVRAIDDVGNSVIVSGSSADIATTEELFAEPAEDDLGAGAAIADKFGSLALGNGDLDNDGFDDLVVVSSDEGDDCQFGVLCDGRIRVFRGGADVDGNLQLAPPVEFTPPGDINQVGYFDITLNESVDGDNFDDLIVSGYTDAGDGFLQMIYGGVSPVLDIAASVKISASTDFVTRGRVVGDLDNDGSPDIAITGFNGTSVYILFGGTRLAADVDLSAGGADIAFVSTTAGGFGSATTGVGDVDGDGFDDFVIDGNSAPDANMYLVHGRARGDWPDSTVAASVSVDTDPATDTLVCAGEACGHEISSGDINGDGAVDLLASAVSSIQVFLANPGASAMATTPSYALVTGGGANTTRGDRSGLSVGDINGDGFDDVVLTASVSANPSGVSVFFGDGRTTGIKIGADISFAMPWIAGDGANVGTCGNLNGDADGLVEMCFGVPRISSGTPGEVRVRH